MNPKLLPKDLQPDNLLKPAAGDFPLSQTNPFTEYRTSLYRAGSDADFLGWIELYNGNQVVGYVYVRRPLRSPYLGSTRYVVMDVTPDFLEPLLRILQSGEPLQIRFEQDDASTDGSAFLEHRR